MRTLTVAFDEDLGQRIVAGPGRACTSRTELAADLRDESRRPKPRLRLSVGTECVALAPWSKDPDLLVVKRSVRAAVVMPLVFAIAHFVVLEPASRVVRGVRLVRPPPPGGVHGTAPRAALVLRRPLRRRRVLHRARHLRFDQQGGRGRDHGAGWLRRALCGDRRAAGGNGDDGCTPDLRPPRRGGAAGVGHRAAPSRLDDRGRLLHRGVHAGVAAPLARQPQAPAVGHRLCGGPPGRRQVSGRERPGGVRRCRRQAPGAGCRAILRHALPPDRRGIGRRGALQARRTSRVGRRHHRHDAARAVVVRAAPGQGRHRAGGRDDAPDRGIAL